PSWAWFELRFLQRGVAGYIGGDLSAFRDIDLFPMHKKKQRCGWKEDDSGCDHGSSHRAHMASAPVLLYCAQGNFLAVLQPHRIHVDVEFSATSHAALGLSFSDRGPRNASARHHDETIHAHILQHLEIDGVALFVGFRRQVASESQLDGGPVLQAEPNQWRAQSRHVRGSGRGRLLGRRGGCGFSLPRTGRAARLHWWRGWSAAW